MAAAEQECSPVNPELASQADATIDVTLLDCAFEPSQVSTEAGVTTFATTNASDQPHELAFLPGGGEVPFTESGEPDEEALAEAGAFERPGSGVQRHLRARARHLHTLLHRRVCIVEAPDGETHCEKGMRGTLEVE